MVYESPMGTGLTQLLTLACTVFAIVAAVLIALTLYLERRAGGRARQYLEDLLVASAAVVLAVLLYVAGGIAGLWAVSKLATVLGVWLQTDRITAAGLLMPGAVVALAVYLLFAPRLVRSWRAVIAGVLRRVLGRSSPIDRTPAG